MSKISKQANNASDLFVMRPSDPEGPVFVAEMRSAASKAPTVVDVSEVAGPRLSVSQSVDDPLVVTVSDSVQGAGEEKVRVKNLKKKPRKKDKKRKKAKATKGGKKRSAKVSEKAEKLEGLAWVAASEASRAVEGLEGLRPLGLIVVRESDEHDMQVFNAMREMTYQNLRHIPAVEAVRAAGMAPFDGDSFHVVWDREDGTTVTREITVERIVHGDTSVLMFFFEGYWHLWSQASAAKVSSFGYNNFTRILTQQIELRCPVTLYAANLSRLIRSEREADKVTMALRDRVDRVDARDQKFDLVGRDAWVGFMMLTIMGWCASSERTAIVQRLLAGRVAQWRKNEWPLGAGSVPFGYSFDRKEKRLVMDESKRDAVREMILVLCSDAPPSLKAIELDRLGVRAFRKDPKTGNYKPFAARSNPEQAIKTLTMWAPVWVMGEYLHRYTNPLGDLDELSGLKIVRHPFNKAKMGRKAKAKDPGELQMLFKVETPADGWAEPELLEAFALKATSLASRLLAEGSVNSPRPLSPLVFERSQNADLFRRLLPAESLNRLDGKSRARRDAARARSTIRPFVGLNWIEDGWFYELQASAQKAYKILRWPLSSMDPGVDPELRRHLRHEGS
jgi:hypothetical protein